MVKKQHKIISLVLCLMLAVSAVLVGTVGAVAASGDTVYVRANNGWTDLYCYMWTDNAGDNGAWPGAKMTKVADGVYSYTLNGNYKKVIFNNNGNGSNQTGDLEFPGDGQIYDLSTGKWSAYSQHTTNPTTPTTATVPSTTAPVITGSYSVYLDNKAGWDTPTCYMWVDSTVNNGAWPGVKMTNIGGDVWQYTSSKEYPNCIFSNSGNSQTADLTAKNGYIYDNSTNTWSVYDTSPLQVTSFGCDPTDVYVNADTVLYAEAKNAQGAAVNYRFSVTAPNGSINIVSDYSTANSVTWTPATAGTYTITFDFVDADGNKNNRTATVEVKDDSTLAKPVIKSVLPMNNGLVATGTPATVSVKAGGGKTGTNLLFYKYIVTNPDGTKNTPYYTLNNSYTFTPNAKGEYTVQVYVQGSDNTTVNKTYKYTAVGEITTTQPGTLPTSPTTPDFVLGDANGDGFLSIDDATHIQKYLADYEGYTVDMKVCDVDGDNWIDIKDVTEIQKILAGIV